MSRFPSFSPKDADLLDVESKHFEDLEFQQLEHESESEKNANAEQMPVTADTAMDWDEPLVTHKQMEEFYPHLEKMLAEIEFMDPKNPRLLPLRLRRLFGRIQLDRMEYHLLRGIFSRVQALSQGTWKKTSMDKEDQSNA